MNSLLYFWATCLITYAAADILKDFTLLGRSGIKSFYISKFTTRYDEAINACKNNNLVLTRLETKKEHDDLNLIFENNAEHIDRAYVGISLLGGKVIQHESRIATTYSVLFYPLQPSGDGTCLEILSEGGHIGINDLSCGNNRHFICETKDDFKKECSTEAITSELESNITRHKDEISLLQGKNDELNVEVRKCLKNLIEIREEKKSELIRCTTQSVNLNSELKECQSKHDQSQESELIQSFKQALKEQNEEFKQNLDSVRLHITNSCNRENELRLNNLDLKKQIQDLNKKLLQSTESTTCQPQTNAYYPAINPRMAEIECKNGGMIRSTGNATECECPVGFMGKLCQHSELFGQDCYMEGNGYVELNRSLIVDGGSIQNNISFALRFSTIKSNGLLFWFGQNNVESTNDEQDFIALFIEDGQLVYVFRCNGSEHRLLTTIAINNGQQCHVIVKQTGNEGSIELLDYNHKVTGHIKPPNEDAKIYLTGNLFLGGAPDLIKFTGGRSVDGFGGCIHLVEDDNGNTINLGMNAVSSLNVGVCPE